MSMSASSPSFSHLTKQKSNSKQMPMQMARSAAKAVLKTMSKAMSMANLKPKTLVKIYIDNYNPKQVSSKMTALNEYLKTTKSISEYISPQGIFRYDNKTDKLYKFNIITDKPTTTLAKYYDGHNLILDANEYEKEQMLSQFPYEHELIKYSELHYCCGVSSHLHLVILGVYENVINVTQNTVKQIFRPTDIYFELDEDIDNMLIKNELNEFLLMLM